MAENWKCGNEFLPFHPQASHVEPAYRDGWNACYRASIQSSLRGGFPVVVKGIPDMALELLVAAGHITRAKADEAVKLATELLGTDGVQEDGRG